MQGTSCWETWGVVCVLTDAHTCSLTFIHTRLHIHAHIPELWCGDLQEAWLTADGATINLFVRDKAALVVSTSMALPLPKECLSAHSAYLHLSTYHCPAVQKDPLTLEKGVLALPPPQEHGFSLQSWAHPWSSQLRAQCRECRAQD